MQAVEILYVYFTISLSVSITSAHSIDLDLGVKQSDFTGGATFKPKVFNRRSKREILSTRISQKDGFHMDDITLALEIEGQQHLIDLSINRELIPSEYFEKYQENGTLVVKNPGPKEVELCHYQGQLRNTPGSWAAISTCHGLSGTVYDGKQLHYLSPATKSHLIHGVDHLLYSHKEPTTNLTCANDENRVDHQILDTFTLHKNAKRSIDVQGPYQSDSESRYVELVLVADRSELNAEGSLQNVISRCKEIANIVNALYKPLNIFIALVGVVVWTEYDEIPLFKPSDTLLESFLEYRSQSLNRNHPNDNAHLITKRKFERNTVGKAMVGGMCSLQNSGGVIHDHSYHAGPVAVTLAHEIGHNFNMSHDTLGCSCGDTKCIMAASSSSSFSNPKWSSCSVKALRHAINNGLDDCLLNKPKKLFDGPTCGNGWLEPGEQCDCGLACDNSCCDPDTCMFIKNATCASGDCCDYQTCQLRRAGSLCRGENNECDLPEYCTGQSEFCPHDVFRMNGYLCKNGHAHCYEGACQTHQEQCLSLWGAGASNAKGICYENNKKGNLYGNCGKNHQHKYYNKCEDEDLMCGRLQCNVDKSRIPNAQNMQSGFYEIYRGYETVHCRTIEVDFFKDPGLVPNGASCAKGKMCIDQKCVDTNSIQRSKDCVNNCSNNGVCNNQGNCHCSAGYSPPACSSAGYGGSVDSGPMADPNANLIAQKPGRWMGKSNVQGSRFAFWPNFIG